MNFTSFKLENYFNRYEFSAPYQLCNSDCEAMSIGELLAFEEGAAERFHGHWLGYTEAQGDPGLREAITPLYDTIQSEQVLCLTGAEEGIFLFMRVALVPGDHLIVQCPAYQSLYQLAEDMGCEVTRWQMQERDDRWELDFDRLREAVNPKTKAIIVNSPHNPTGFLLNQEQLHTLVDIARQHDLYLFCDEVYKGLEFGDAPPVSAGCDLYEKAISLGVLSKSFGLAGLRIGWTASQDRKLLSAMQEFKYYTTICNSAPSEFLAELALRHQARLLERNTTLVRENVALAQEFFADYASLFRWIPPQAGPIAFPSLRIEQSVEAFCQELVETQGVLLAPGTMFGDDRRHFRMGFGRRNFPDNLAQFRTYLERK